MEKTEKENGSVSNGKIISITKYVVDENRIQCLNIIKYHLNTVKVIKMKSYKIGSANRQNEHNLISKL